MSVFNPLKGFRISSLTQVQPVSAHSPAQQEPNQKYTDCFADHGDCSYPSYFRLASDRGFC